MTDLTVSPSARSRLDLRAMLAPLRDEPLFAGAALMMLFLAVPTLAAMALDERTVNGINVWIKPLKFQVSLALFLATLAAFARWVPADVRGRRWYRAFAAVTVLCVALEMIWLMGTAANGVGAHFNVTPPIMQMVYFSMGLIAIVLTASTMVYAVLIGRHRALDLDPAVRLSVVLGLVLTFVLTLIAAGYLASGTGHFVGGNDLDVEGMPLTGWARDGGDLRVPHFFATHAMQVLPFAGLAAGRWLSARRARWAVWGGAVGYVALVAGTMVQAVAGQPFLPFLGG